MQFKKKQIEWTYNERNSQCKKIIQTTKLHIKWVRWIWIAKRTNIRIIDRTTSIAMPSSVTSREANRTVIAAIKHGNKTQFCVRSNFILIISLRRIIWKQKTFPQVDVGSDNDDNSSCKTLSIDKARPVERARGPDLRLQLPPRVYNTIAGGNGFPFLYQQIEYYINPHQTRHLIHALCRWNERFPNQIITMLFTSVTRHIELRKPFFKLLTLLTESVGPSESGLPCFSQLVWSRVSDAAELCPQSELDWLAVQAPRNKIAYAWILPSAESWVEQFFLAHNNAKVQNGKLKTSNRYYMNWYNIWFFSVLFVVLHYLAAVYLLVYFGLMTYYTVLKTGKLMVLGKLHSDQNFI